MTRKQLISIPRYIIINGIFAAAIYFGFFEAVEGAKNLALFIAWLTGLFGVLVLFALWIDSLEDYSHHGELREQFSRHEQSVIPWPVDLLFDVCVTLVFIWFGHYVLSIFYILSIAAGKQLRNIPKDVMLKNLKSMQQ
jgi:hypothetical protein